MKALFATLGLAALMLLSACNTGSSSSNSASTANASGGAADSGSGDSGGSGSGGSGSLDPGPTTDSKFDVVVSSFVNSGSVIADRTAVVTDASSADILEGVKMEAWFKSASTDYAKYFQPDGSMQEKEPGKPYEAAWYAYQEGNPTVGIDVSSTLQTRKDRISFTIPNTSSPFSGSKKVILLLRIYEPDTASKSIDKAGVQDWELTLSKTSAVLDLSKVKLKAKQSAASTFNTDAATGAFNEKSSAAISASYTATLATEGTTTNNFVTLKELELIEGSSADLFISIVKGSDPVPGSISQTYINSSFTGNITITDAMPYTNTVRIDFTAKSGETGKLTLTIADKKYGLSQNVVLTFTHQIT